MKSRVLHELAQKGVRVLSEVEARQVLEEYGIPCPKEAVAKYAEGKRGEEYLRELKSSSTFPGYPAYLKVVSREITSKTDAGAVKRVLSEDEVKEAIEAIVESAKRYQEGVQIQGILMSEDVSTRETRELLLGSTIDEQFGHVISLGFGGIYVEAYKDVEFRVLPITEPDIRDVLRCLKGREVLGEFRGMRPINIDLLIQAVLSLSKLIEENPEIVELDINPLLVGPDRAIAVDSLIRISG